MKSKEELQEKHAAIEAQMRKLAEEKLSIESSIHEIEYKESHEVYAIGKIKYNLWWVDERFGDEISDGDYLTASEILGRPDFKAGQKVVLMKDDDYRWYSEEEGFDGPSLDEDSHCVKLVTKVKEKI